ncbi:beta-galactosidase [Bifidobacterium myosotis]|uniref:beta-galactosidase n=1 Tax=Bifidobacterium myosotis TaxID=1630166 RepID=A0A5M9ZQC4_9BIFI|nr:beta-galactosidase [Bifidobacterium myosotis]KAA8829846.1 beta-galactosidase [Bifidobacterium myosotis]
MNRILFGAAYYDEYMPYDRLNEDVSMLKAAHMNTVRIAESTWATLEPHPGEFDFSHVDRVIDAMEDAGINVIVGTPTYAVPAWLTASHPDVLVRQHVGQRRYGPRQIMDIINDDFRVAAERVIRALVSHVADRKAVIGFQLDNETKYYDALNDDVQQAFIDDLRARFDNDLDRLNAAFGLNYWSNRINSWEEFPDLTETINGSLGGEFDRFRRSLVAQYLQWQADIVHEYARDDQFVTQNFDLDWRGHSFGVQPWADHFECAPTLDYAGIDIYHPTESKLTGREIAFGGDMTRSLKGGRNYLLLETEAQGQNGWLPYPGQLRLQAYSHLASGSNSVMYWHWHSIHNSFETYWKGVLSHDFQPNNVYREASRFGEEIERIGSSLINLSKKNHVAILVSNLSLSALNRFTIETGFPKPHPYEEGDSSGLVSYNDVVRWVYDALFSLNVEVDFLPADHLTAEPGYGERLASYDLVIAPALYCASDGLIDALREYVAGGGHLVATFKSFFTDEHSTVRPERQPYGLTDVFGLGYGEFTRPDSVGLDFSTSDSGSQSLSDVKAEAFMELLEPFENTEVIARYRHAAWGDYAAVTRNAYGHGWAEWIGTMSTPEVAKMLMAQAVHDAGLSDWTTEFADRIRVRCGRNDADNEITYLLNYSPETVSVELPISGRDLLDPERTSRHQGDLIQIAPWDLDIIETSD